MKVAAPNALHNGEPVPVADIPVPTIAEFREQVLQACEAGARLAALFARPADSGRMRLFAVLASDADGELALWSAVAPDHYPSLTPACAQAQGFERELAEQWGLHPDGHPWLKPVRYHHSYREGHDAWGRGSENADSTGCRRFLFDARRRSP